MIKELSPHQLPEDQKKAYDNWLSYFTDSINALSFKPYIDFKGEDKNILAWQSKEAFISWYGQSPGIEAQPYRDNGFYVRELTWLSMWCSPKTVVEMGTDKGIGTFLLSRLNPQATIHTVDNKPEVFMPGDLKVETGLFAKQNDFNMSFHIGQSDQLTIEDVDLCFIDGDHSKHSVWQDSLRAWANRPKQGRWVMIWHDYRDGEDFVGLKIAINRFSDVVRKKVYKLMDSTTVWMTNDD